MVEPEKEVEVTTKPKGEEQKATKVVERSCEPTQEDAVADERDAEPTEGQNRKSPPKSRLPYSYFPSFYCI